MKSSARLASAVLLLTLAGCSSGSDVTSADATSSATPSASAAVSGGPSASAPGVVGPVVVPSAGPEASGQPTLDAVPRVTLGAGQVSGQPCDEVTGLSARPTFTSPKDMVLAPGAEVFMTKGSEYRYPVLYTVFTLSPPDVAAARDLAVRTLQKAGYKLVSSDQEPNVEATAAMANAVRKVNVQVIQLCRDKVRIRYTPVGNAV